jgi:hypothetical protein
MKLKCLISAGLTFLAINGQLSVFAQIISNVPLTNIPSANFTGTIGISGAIVTNGITNYGPSSLDSGQITTDGHGSLSLGGSVASLGMTTSNYIDATYAAYWGATNYPLDDSVPFSNAMFYASTHGGVVNLLAFKTNVICKPINCQGMQNVVFVAPECGFGNFAFPTATILALTTNLPTFDCLNAGDMGAENVCFEGADSAIAPECIWLMGRSTNQLAGPHNRFRNCWFIGTARVALWYGCSSEQNDFDRCSFSVGPRSTNVALYFGETATNMISTPITSSFTNICLSAGTTSGNGVNLVNDCQFLNDSADPLQGCSLVAENPQNLKLLSGYFESHYASNQIVLRGGCTGVSVDACRMEYSNPSFGGVEPIGIWLDTPGTYNNISIVNGSQIPPLWGRDGAKVGGLIAEGSWWVGSNGVGQVVFNVDYLSNSIVHMNDESNSSPSPFVIDARYKVRTISDGSKFPDVSKFNQLVSAWGNDPLENGLHLQGNLAIDSNSVVSGNSTVIGNFIGDGTGSFSGNLSLGETGGTHQLENAGTTYLGATTTHFGMFYAPTTGSAYAINGPGTSYLHSGPVGLGGDSGWAWGHNSASAAVGSAATFTPDWEVFENGNGYLQGLLTATNGLASCGTNVLTPAAATSWTGQMTTLNNGITNTYGTNMFVNVTASSGNLIFWKCGGIAGVTPCANPLFTNGLSTNGWNRWVPPNCGVQLVGAVTPVVTVDF